MTDSNVNAYDSIDDDKRDLRLLWPHGRSVGRSDGGYNFQFPFSQHILRTPHVPFIQYMLGITLMFQILLFNFL